MENPPAEHNNRVNPEQNDSGKDPQKIEIHLYDGGRVDVVRNTPNVQSTGDSEAETARIKQMLDNQPAGDIPADAREWVLGQRPNIENNTQKQIDEERRIREMLDNQPAGDIPGRQREWVPNAEVNAEEQLKNTTISALLLEIQNIKISVENLRASKQGGGPELASMQPGQLEAALAQPETQKSLWERGVEKVKKIDFLSFGVGAGAGAATRIGLRTALGAKTLGATLAIGAGAGAVTGGVREWVKQLRYGNYSESFKESLVNLKDSKSFELIQEKVKIQKALNEEILNNSGISGSAAIVDEYRQQIATIDRVLEFKVEQNGSKPKVKDLKRFLEVDFNKAQELIGGQKSPEFQKLSAELKENRWKKGKIGKAILKGAIFGAVGAGMANAVMDFAGAHGWLPAGLGGGEAAASHVAENGLSHETINNCIAGQVLDKGAGASEHILSEARAHLAEHSFGVHIQHGDGATHIARRAIHDYLVNEKHLEGVHFKEPNLAELVNAEDTLRREIEQQVGSVIPGSHIGSIVEVHGQSIEKVLQHAMGLHENQIDHVNSILAEPAHHISEANQNLMTHHDTLWSNGNGAETQNDFFSGSEHSAAEASAQAIKTCAENPTTGAGIMNSIAHNGAVQRMDGVISSAAHEANGAKGKIFAGFLAGGILGTLFGRSQRKSPEVVKPPIPENPKQTVKFRFIAPEMRAQAADIKTDPNKQEARKVTETDPKEPSKKEESKETESDSKEKQEPNPKTETEANKAERLPNTPLTPEEITELRKMLAERAKNTTPVKVNNPAAQQKNSSKTPVKQASKKPNNDNSKKPSQVPPKKNPPATKAKSKTNPTKTK